MVFTALTRLKCKKGLHGPDAFETQKKRGLYGPDELHELEVLLPKLVMQMPKRHAIDCQTCKNRPVDRDRLVGLPCYDR